MARFGEVGVRILGFWIFTFSVFLTQGNTYEFQQQIYGTDGDNSHGLFPNVFNLAATAEIAVNATCGKSSPEVYCKLVEHVDIFGQEDYRRSRESQEHCGTCDNRSPDKKHPIENAIDGTNNWWQSPTLQNGKQYEWVTITLDLKQVYQIAYVIVKAAISPRPGNWILERSLDSIIYLPWQYYAVTDSECWNAYGIRPTIGKPHYRTDNEVICTSYYSKLNPLENGEIHTSLLNGRPGVDGPSTKLMEFTKARYVRLRLQRIRTLNADLMTIGSSDPENIDKLVTRRYFYSIKDISVGGQCACSGHASSCISDPVTGNLRCECKHHTCGENCDRCCPLYNQKQWNHGTSDSAEVCEKCECYGHSEKCHYDQNVADKRLSINTRSKYQGGGVCDNCKHHTSGINCEKCEDGYFRPSNVPKNHTKPCRKCKCDGPGMTGLCVKDDSHLLEGLEPGDCFCKSGFAGKNCDTCDIGYRNYPLCTPCPCHTAGTIGGSICEGECVCKTHVEGSRCDKCRAGFYHLSADNPDGCSQCFCFGMTDECTEADWGVNIIQNIEDWRVTDLDGKRIVKPLPENGNVVIANDDVSMFSSYYWLAPPDYLGKKLYSYGSDLTFTLSYVVARGDTSGTYTENADVVLDGNGQRIGYNWGVRAEEEEVAISVPLREQGWFLLTPREDGTKSVSREEFTLILNSLTKLLIRAKFHTDQIEGRLHNIGMEIAAEDSKSIRQIGSVEKCICPVGYSGLSCELCAPGYRPKTGPKMGHICDRCDCYNHAESCDNPTGRCENCLHHTTGLKCDRCVRGYYGNATIGTPDDCKPCACPLENSENNFSPSCTAIQSTTGDSDYICDLCPEGYDGNKCERCSDGWFGNPQVPGGYCQKCDCSGNADTSVSGWCDSLTGQCLKCLGNTAGWNCAECKPEHYGNPALRNCQPCSCNSFGSLSSQCDVTTGQCLCKTGVVGRTCNRCADGYGNLEAGCEPCKCNQVGSRTEVCDPVTGYCSCKPGVFGITCDSCLDGYFGFSRQGCQECRCDRLGSFSVQCDENNGQCACKPHVIGRTCDRCEDGYWNLQSGNGCEKCHCNRTASLASVCNKNDGQCNCKPGVGGQFCDQCLPGFFMFTNQGCRSCEPCDRPGHICDPTNGRCVCPPHTTGSRCQKCERNAWGYDPVRGCKPCNCNRQGSPEQSCDPETGNCICLEGFEGRLCDQCRHGFYSFPNCHKCDCNFDGSIAGQCRDTVCQCNSRGDCPCKELVTGQKCNRCVDGAFGLSAEVLRGCHECFCFGKTRVCDQASMYWSKIQFPSRDVMMEIGTSDIQSRVGFQIFPEEESGNRLGIPYVLDKPLYWSLPKNRLGDKVLSYNGYLTFNLEVRGSSHFPDRLLERYPSVVLQGNQRIILIHTQPKQPAHLSYRVHLHEGEWKLYDNPLLPVTKTVLMVALQNLQYLLIRGTDGPELKYARLYNVSIDVAAASGYSPSVAKGVEMCRCPREYIGTSCQDPAPGYYRKRKPNYLNSKDVLDLVGWAEPCACNNHSNICDKETGVCINCAGNTMGDHCDHCIKGYYGDPSRGPCRPCACPHPANSFSDTCVPDAVDYVCINCQQGYSGRHCERCDNGYYGDLSKIEGKCSPCNCNPYGSRTRECDPRTGQCECNEGVSGRDCTICSHGFILTEYGCKSCDDECTGILLKELYEMKLKTDSTNVTDLPRLPWGYLNRILGEEQRLRPLVDDYQKNVSMGKDLIDQFTSYLDLEAKADLLLVKATDYIKRARNISGDSKDTLDEAEKMLIEIQKIFHELKDLVAELEARATDPTSPVLSLERILAEAERMLTTIKSRNFGPDKEEAERELRKAQNLLNNVKKLTLDRALVDTLKEKMKVLQDLLDDLVRKIDDKVRKPVERTVETYQIGTARKEAVVAMIDEINGYLESSNTTLKEANDLLTAANSALIDASVKFEYLPRHLRELSNATNQLDELRSKLARLNPLYKEKYVIPAQKHADELEKQSQRLANLFKPTKELSNVPLKAAKAYQNIIDAISAADLAAQEAERAAENAYREAYPPIGESLSERADDARTKSLRLLAEAQKLNEEKIPELEGKMRARKKDLDDLSEDLAFGKRSNDLINKELDALPKGVQGFAEGAAEKARLAEAKAKRANNKADRLLNRLDNDLLPKFESIRASTVGGLENLTRMIEQAREDTRTASRLADNADASAKRVRKQHEITKLNLKELKDKILLARQKASSIKIGLTSDYNGKCVRSYVPVIEPTTTNSIVLNFATKSNKRDSLLFFIGSKKEEDFMAIEMVNRRIRFLWNVGGGTQVITHDKEIETNSEQFLKNSQWFKIEANRIGNVGTLSVKRTPDGQKPDPYEVTGSSTAGFTKMDLDASSAFFIGGFPINFLGPSELQTSSFSGCLYEAFLDGKPVGLWNFLTNEGCDACKEGATEDIDINAFEFQGGDSYAILSQIPYYKKGDIYAVLSFKTLNEDALLFFSGNNFRGHMMSLELKGGKVVFQIKMDNKVHIRLESKQKYNTGQWIRVEVAREKFEAQMQVESEFLDENIVRSSSSALELRETAMYYGGVPPNFTAERWPEVTFTTFFGCMKDLQIDSTPIDLNKGNFYGMITGCSNRPLKIATFKGAGYLEMNGQPISGDSSISFSFMTNQNDAILLISTFSGQDVTNPELVQVISDVNDPELLQNYYSVSLKEGRIVTMFSSAGGEIQMASNRLISHGIFHTVNVIKRNKRLILRLDDEEENEIRLPKGAKGIASPSKGGLFFGGVRRNVNIGNMAGSQQPFIGIIQDAIFNDRLLRFENTVSHKNVDFGRPNFKKMAETPFQQMAPSPPDESCSPDLRIDEEAVSLQSGKSTEIHLSKKDFVNSFNVSIDYRTFYPEGKIISLTNVHKKLRLSLYLEKGLVKVDITKKKHQKNGNSKKELAIGKWHKVDLIKKGKQLLVFLDKKESITINVPKKLPFNKLLIGGIHKEVHGSFKGCFRHLHVNDKKVKIPSDNPCFKHVDFGAYLTGIGYITQDPAFHLNKELDLQFQFRTTRFDGSIFSIFSTFTGAWIELCLSENTVVATLFEEENLKLQLTQAVNADGICDYRWHDIKLTYKDSNFVLNIDDSKPVERNVKNKVKDLGFAEIYVGGKPDKYQSLGKCTNSFSGCIRRITLNGEGLQIKNPESEDNIVQFMCPQL